MPAGTLTRVISSTWSKLPPNFSNVWWLSILQGRFPSKCTTHRYESLLDRWKTAKSLAMECMQVSWFPDGSPRIRYGAWTTEIVRMVYFATRALWTPSASSSALAANDLRPVAHRLRFSRIRQAWCAPMRIRR